MGTFSQAFVEADFFGKLIFLSLFTLSIICWFFLIRKVSQIREVKKGSLRFREAVQKKKESLLHLDLELLPKQMSQKSLYPFGYLYLTLREKTGELLDKNHFFIIKKENAGKKEVFLSRTDIELIDSHLQKAIVKQKEQLEKNLFVLSTTVTLAPFLGLLGTVWGILITFGELQKGHSASSSQVILGGLSTALTTTVLGLLIAIPALVGYNYLKNSSRRFASEMRDFGHFLVSTVELQYRKVDLYN